jgi:small ligand-binding sensory domain FIST
MAWAAAVSGTASFDRAAREVVDDLRSQFGGASPDLAFVFVSSEHAEHYERVPEAIGAPLGASTLVGCSGEGIIGAGRELESRPGISVTAGSLPGTRLRALHVGVDDLPAEGAPAAAWEELFGSDASRARGLVLLSDPFTFEPEPFLKKVDAAFPATRKVGGLASGGRGSGSSAFFVDEHVHRDGTAAVVLEGNVRLETIVAQGCRPIGDPMFVTGAKRNALTELNGRPAIEVLGELFESLDDKDRELFKEALFLGIAMRESQTEFQHGDFLIRNLFGVDARSKAVIAGALLQEHQIVQFHLRDAETSRQDLQQALDAYRMRQGEGRLEAALLFSCLGRGEQLYGHPDHDTDLFRESIGSVPMGGFFCNGEIGPVQGFTFLHGYTSSFGLLKSER